MKREAGTLSKRRWQFRRCPRNGRRVQSRPLSHCVSTWEGGCLGLVYKPLASPETGLKLLVGIAEGKRRAVVSDLPIVLLRQVS